MKRLRSALARRAAASPTLPRQAYPNRTITVVVPFPAGGSVDGVARILVQKLNQIPGWSAIVENRAGGAGGTVGANTVAKAAPDGYTLMLTASVNAINPLLFKNLPYDFVNDFTPITLLAIGPLLVSAPPTMPVSNLKEFFDLVRKDQQKYTFGHTSPGSASHLAMELLKRDAKLDTLIIAYKGTAPALNDLMGGHHSPARRSDAVVAAARAGRQDQGARGHQPEADGGGAGRSHRRRGGHEGLRAGVLVWRVGAESLAG